MPKNRLEAFSDGVLAIIITIMVLAMEAPEGKSWRDLGAVIPTFIGYIISYTYVGIYWVNHHRLLQSVETIKGRSLWANLLWMFFASLIPFATAWASNTGFAAVPVSLYGGVLFLTAIAYQTLDMTIRHAKGQMDSLWTVATGGQTEPSHGHKLCRYGAACLHLCSCGLFDLCSDSLFMDLS